MTEVIPFPFLKLYPDLFQLGLFFAFNLFSLSDFILQLFLLLLLESTASVRIDLFELISQA
jgi:hypothetical protein